jgi:hypothetical protein
MDAKSWLNLQTKTTNDVFADSVGHMNFLGTTSTELSDGATNTYVDIGGNYLVAKVGDVVHTLSSDYIYGGKTWEALGLGEAHINIPKHSDSKPFSCPHCGGNQTERRNGKTVCAYCLTEVN